MDTIAISNHAGALACARAGLDTTRQQLPNILKIVIPYIVISSLAAFLLVGSSQFLGTATVPSDIQNPEVARAVMMSVLKSAALFLLLVLPFSAFTSFVTLRLGSCDPLPSPESQSAGSLWRFELRFLGYLVLLICQVISSIIFAIPAAILGFIVGALLFFLPAPVVRTCAQIPAMYMLALWGGFFVVSSMKFLGVPGAGIGDSIRFGLRFLRTNISLWSRLAVVGLVAVIALELLTYLLASALSSLPLVNMVASSALTMIVYLPMLFVYRAGYKACV